MRKALSLALLGTALLGVAAPAHAGERSDLDEALDPLQKIAGATVCNKAAGTTPVVGRYHGVVAKACAGGVRQHTGTPPRR
ncbi:hypothetical protein ABZ419_18635 [Streptomyces cinnamoneus]|uniref:hypothetical protein n=1 Tax=Streptomyces cinnamoneus TaxID=53446 RepID=UPI0033EB9FF4